jgi:hypothetical protein
LCTPKSTPFQYCLFVIQSGAEILVGFVNEITNETKGAEMAMEVTRTMSFSGADG